MKGLEHAVHIVRDEDRDRDLGWSVELSIPWDGLREAAGGGLPEYPRLESSRTAQTARKGLGE